MANFATLTAPPGVNFIILPPNTTVSGLTGIHTLNTLSTTCTTMVKPFSVITASTNNRLAPASGTPPIKPAKKFRDEQEEILRCKRRLDFASLGLQAMQRPRSGVCIQRRNERERNRVKNINSTFSNLRQHLPSAMTSKSEGKNKKMSKVDTLRGAIEYIQGLQTLLDEHDAVQAAFSSGYISPDVSSQSESMELSPSPTASICPSEHSTAEVDAPLSPDEVDLLDFASWFD